MAVPIAVASVACGVRGGKLHTRSAATASDLSLGWQILRGTYWLHVRILRLWQKLRELL